jgi:hypothetical protein
MDDLPTDIMRLILLHLDCEDAMSAAKCSRTCGSAAPCASSMFSHEDNTLYGCKIHYMRDRVSYIVHTLLHTQDKPSTIHFRSPLETEIAMPYLYKFGEIHHTCCDGKGVMYESAVTLSELHGTLGSLEHLA